MVSRRLFWWLLTACGFGLCLLVLSWAILRFTHHLPLQTSRAVDFLGGRVTLEIPRLWMVGYDTDPPYGLRITHIGLPIWADLTLDDRLVAPQSSGMAVLHSLGIAHPLDLGDGRAGASLPREDGMPGMVHHVARVDPHGRLLHLKLAVQTHPEAEWWPSIAADMDFLRASMQRVALNGDQEIARKEYDEWAPARAALREIEADFQLSFNVLIWALGTFIVVWIASHLLFETWLKLGKVGYTWVSQATTLVSLAGLALAGTALVSNRMEHRAKLAESVTLQVASTAIMHMRAQAELCQKDWVVSIKLEPLVQNSKMVEIDCTRFSGVMWQLASHFAHAGNQIVKQGDFVDPRWTLGMPISMYVGTGDRIIGAAGLNGEQHHALSNRYMFFMEPLEQALRVVQKQSDYLASAKAFRQLSSLWSICLAGALALGMVKLSGDRRIERSKDVAKDPEASGPPPAPPSPAPAPAPAPAPGTVYETPETASTASEPEPPPIQPSASEPATEPENEPANEPASDPDTPAPQKSET